MSASWVAFAVAQDKGFFADAGVKVQLQFAGTTGTLLQSMAVNRIDVGIPTTDGFLAAVDQGQDLKMFYSVARRAESYLAVLPDSPISSMADLKGKTIGVQALSSGPTTLARSGLRQAGLDPDKDVSFVAVGLGAPALDAMQKARVDAVMLYNIAYSTLETTSNVKLKYIRTPENADLFATTVVAKKSWITDNPAAVKGFGRALTKAYIWSIAHPEDAIRAMWKFYPESKTTSDDAAEMKLALANFQAKMADVNVGDPTGTRTWGKYDPAAVQHWIDFAVENGTIKQAVEPSDVYTNEFVSEYNRD
jgi:NitT/TauT family transport system substrate-binding protein